MPLLIRRPPLLASLAGSLILVGAPCTGAAENKGVPTCAPAVFDASKLSVVRIDVDGQTPGPAWPDGCVLHVKANDGATIAIRLTNVNTRKYRVVFDGKVEERAKEDVPGALSAFLAQGLPAAPTKPSANETPEVKKLTLDISKFAGANVSDDQALQLVQAYRTAPADTLFAQNLGVSETAKIEVKRLVAAFVEEQALLARQADRLRSFHDKSTGLETVAKGFEKALAASKRAEDYGELLREVKTALGPMATQESLNSCIAASFDAATCRTQIEALPEKLEESTFKQLAADRMSLVDASKVPGASLDSVFVAHAVETKYAAAIAMKEKLPNICKEVAAFFDKTGTESSLFTKQHTYDFTGDPMRISVRIESGADKDAWTKYGMEVRVEPARAMGFAFSTGLVFAGLTDRDYAVENGRIRRKGDSGPIRPGVSVLAHWLLKHGWAASAGISGADSDLMYLVGLSHLWGSKQRFVVTGGAAVGSVRRLDSLDEDDEFTESTVPTKDVTAIGAFLSISFKF